MARFKASLSSLEGPSGPALARAARGVWDWVHRGTPEPRLAEDLKIVKEAMRQPGPELDGLIAWVVGTLRAAEAAKSGPPR
jgi:hypothetical protein